LTGLVTLLTRVFLPSFALLSIELFKVETQRIIEITERMAKDQQDFFARVEAILTSMNMINEDWIDGVEVQAILRITRKTVYRLTKDGTLEARRIGRRNYYLRSSIFKLRNRFLK